MPPKSHETIHLSRQIQQFCLKGQSHEKVSEIMILDDFQNFGIARLKATIFQTRGFIRFIRNGGFCYKPLGRTVNSHKMLKKNTLFCRTVPLAVKQKTFQS
jgi:hypothetical protein